MSTKGDQIKTLWQVSEDAARKQAQTDANEAVYFDSLKKAQSEPGFFNKVPEDSNSEHIRSIQKRINTIV